MAQQQQNKLPVIGGLDLNKVQKDLDTWVKAQHPAIEVALVTVGAALQGGMTGFAFGYLFKELGSSPPPGQPADALSQQLKVLSTGGPLAQAKSLATLLGVNAGLNLAVKKLRGGKEDVWTVSIAGFGAGFLYHLISQDLVLTKALGTGASFGIMYGLFHQLGHAFKPAPETDYEHTKGLLTRLGLQKYYDNVKKQLLNDSTIMLWNESALTSANIPAGPRLLILHHLDSIRNPAAHVRSGYLPPNYFPPPSVPGPHHPVSAVLKPALAVGPPPAATQPLLPPHMQQQAGGR